MKRLHQIDGIRGWAALAVLLSHLTEGVFGKLFPQYESLFLRVFFDGYLAVCIFFILSGDALSAAFLSTHRNSILAKMVVKRYFRLAGPILASTILVYLLMRFGLIYSQQAAEITHSNAWLGSFLNFEPHFGDALKFGLRFAFTDAGSSQSYDTFLWPMGIELVGSFGLFLYLAIYRNLKYPFIFLGLCVVGFTASRSYYGLFCIGIILSHLRVQGFFDKVFMSEEAQRWVLFGSRAWLALAIGACLMNEKFFQVVVLLAGLFVFLSYCRESYIDFFSNAISRYLGRISFPLYITHFAVIVSYTSYSVEWLSSRDLLNLKSSILVVISSAVFAILVADVFSRLESWYLQRLDKVASIIIQSD